MNTLLVTCMMIMKLSHYIKCFKNKSVRKTLLWSTKWMSDLIGDDDLMEKYNTIWDKVSADIKKYIYIFDSEPIYNKKNFDNQNYIWR